MSTFRIRLFALYFVFLFPALANASHALLETSASEGGEGTKLAVPFQFGFTESANVFPKEAIETMGRVANVSFGIVQMAKPKGDTVFEWLGDKEITTSADPRLKDLAKLPGGIDRSLDALTMVEKRRDGTYVITTLLLADRLFYDEKGNERKDSMARTAVAMGHEIQGNVQTFLKRDFDKFGQMTFDKRKSDEIQAFQSGVDFIGRFMEDPKFKKIPEKVQNDFAEALKREKAGLANWKAARP